MLNANDIIPLFGKAADSPEMTAIFEKLNTLRRPSLDEEDERSYHDWVLVRKQGVELGFVDSHYFNARPDAQWRHGELILCQVYFFAEFDDVSTFKGELPFGLTFSDDRATARGKLKDFESARRSWLTDSWTLPEFRLTVSYDTETGLVDCVICRKLALPIAPTNPTVCTDIELMISMLGSALESDEVTRVFDPELLEAQLDEDEVDMTYVYGTDLHLAQDEDGNQIVRSITFHANRSYDSPGWTGPLPMNLSFSDSPLTLREKLGVEPIQESDSPTTGHGVWELPEFTLHVLYSNVDNQLIKVTMRAPGTWECIDDDDDTDDD